MYEYNNINTTIKNYTFTRGKLCNILKVVVDYSTVEKNITHEIILKTVEKFL